MNKWAKISIIGGVILLFVVLLYFFGMDSEEKDEKFVTDSWVETFKPEDKGPYGTYMLKELMDTVGLFGNFLQLDTPLVHALSDNDELNDIYFFIGRQNYMDDTSANFLLDFVDSGNTAFIATTVFPEKFLDRIKYSYNDIFKNHAYDSTQHFKFLHPHFSSQRYTYDYIYNNKKKLKTWRYFNRSAIDISIVDTVISLGANTEGHLNFIKLKYGNGLIYLHSTPYLFTNICMMKRSGFQYVERVLKHIPPGRVQWDRYNLDYYSGSDDPGEGGGGEERKSIFQFILDHPPLIWASVIFLLGALLYVIFKGKRMQKIVPATESRENTSLRYVNTLASLYMQEKQHGKLVRLKKKTFLNFIAEKYYITTKNPDEKFFEKLSVKSQINRDDIADLFKRFNVLEQSHAVTDDQLILLHKKIENFYKNCK